MPVEPVTGSALVSGGVALANGISQVASNTMSQKKWKERQKYLEEQQMRAEKRQYDYNKDLQDYAYKMNLEQWNRENAYNAPSAQMQRLANAGLNANLFYGDGVSSMASANSPTMQIDGSNAAAPAAAPYSEIPNLGGNFVEAAGLGINAALQSAQIRKLNAETLLSLNDLDFKDASFDLRLQQVAESLTNTIADTDVKNATAENLRTDTAGKEISNEIADATKGTAIEQAKVNLENTKRTGWNLEKMGRQIDAMTGKLKTETALLKVQKEIAEYDRAIRKVDADNADVLMDLRKKRENVAISLMNKQDRLLQKELRYYDKKAVAALALSAAETFNRQSYGKLATSNTTYQEFRNKMNDILLDPTTSTDARTYFSALILKNMDETSFIDVMKFISNDVNDVPDIKSIEEKKNDTVTSSETSEHHTSDDLFGIARRYYSDWLRNNPNATDAQKQSAVDWFYKKFEDK